MTASPARPKRRPAPETPPRAADSEPAAEPPAATATGLPPASVEAKRLAAAILEVLAGARGPSEAAQVLSISLARYYQLETRAVAGLVAACEPRRRRRGTGGPVNELAALRQECQRLRRDCARQQALVRAAQRTVGLSPTVASETPAPAGGSKKRRKRRPTARALKMAALLQADDTEQHTGEDGPAVTLANATTATQAAP